MLFSYFPRGMNKVDRGGPPHSSLYPPPPIPLSPYSLLSAARASRTQNFLLFPFLPFPNFSPLSLPHPLISNPLLPCPPPPSSWTLFCFSVAKAMNCFRFFFFFLFFFLFVFLFFFFICTKLWKDKSNRYVGMKIRHLAGQNIAGVNKRLMHICISLLHVSVFPYFGEDGRAIRRRLS